MDEQRFYFPNHYAYFIFRWYILLGKIKQYKNLNSENTILSKKAVHKQIAGSILFQQTFTILKNPLQ